jgi:hypothetical protein
VKRRRHLIRPEDALADLHRALVAPHKSKEQRAHLEAALRTYFAGWCNRHSVGVEGDRRGGNRAPIDDNAALAHMRELAKITGEKQKRVLARLVVEAGIVELNGAQPESIITRLAAKYPGAK